MRGQEPSALEIAAEQMRLSSSISAGVICTSCIQNSVHTIERF